MAGGAPAKYILQCKAAALYAVTDVLGGYGVLGCKVQVVQPRTGAITQLLW